MYTLKSAQDFKTAVLCEFYAAMQQNLNDNFDARRHNLDGRDHSTEFRVQDHCWAMDWFFRRHADLFEAWKALSDPASRSLFQTLLVFRLAGHLHVRLPSAPLRCADRFAALQRAAQAQPSKLALSGMFGQLAHYDFDWEGHHFEIDCIPGGLSCALAYKQYRYERDGVQIGPMQGDHVIDGGACLGDTAMLFSNLVGASGKVYAFDPVEDNLLVCMENMRHLAHDNVVVFPVGLSNDNVDAPPIKVGAYAPGFNPTQAGQCKVPVRTIDFLVASGEIERIDFIKFDIEGSEMDGLKGAHACIERFRPRLAISLYHRPDDMFQIITHLQRHFPFYEFFVDHYTIHQEETVLYARPRLN